MVKKLINSLIETLDHKDRFIRPPGLILSNCVNNNDRQINVPLLPNNVSDTLYCAAETHNHISKSTIKN